MCKFLGSLTRPAPTAKGGELWFACEGKGFSTGGRAHSSPFLVVRTDESNTCASFCANAGICAFLTTDRDLDSAISDKKREPVSTVIFTGPNVFGIHKSRNIVFCK